MNSRHGVFPWRSPPKEIFPLPAKLNFSSDSVIFKRRRGTCFSDSPSVFENYWITAKIGFWGAEERSLLAGIARGKLRVESSWNQLCSKKAGKNVVFGLLLKKRGLPSFTTNHKRKGLVFALVFVRTPPLQIRNAVCTFRFSRRENIIKHIDHFTSQEQKTRVFAQKSYLLLF